MLLPATMLARRGDWAATIGRALELRAAGLGQRPIATAVGACRSTVRGWLSRFVVVAETVRAHLTRWAVWLDPGLVRVEPSGSRVGNAVAAVAAAGAAAAARLGVACRWQFASAVTGGAAACQHDLALPEPVDGANAASRRHNDEEELAMEDRRRRDIALFRYELTRAAADGTCHRPSAAAGAGPGGAGAPRA